MVEFAFLSTGNIERFTRNLSLRKQQLKLGMDYSYCEDGIHNQPIMVLQSTFSFAKSKVCFGAVAGP